MPQHFIKNLRDTYESFFHILFCFIYLISEVSNTSDLLIEINRRYRLAVGVIRDLWRPLWCWRNISQHTKLWVYNAIVLFVLIYGAKTWPLSKTLHPWLCPTPSGPSRVCTGQILCPIRSSAGERSSQAYSTSLLNTVFAGLVMPCDNLITTLPESPTGICKLVTTS